mmetsp:Transcript_13815/g.33737  ORF Transcript_13815/g.33737 Transcript_13815/m.33737 type:complete len:276 (-) Transcript_13815:321-1148(-)|eukprot:CAMPEP_0114522614 /NCGR_PEP_ID=MMETSP0109-20121206/20830_1 /TAXON_ID=29199 /ORGANISM="Chlorarachnion reptans, Strain CCCM449" /LENGTH=275 /DNA_ID=CAMNT_0001703831 /DNA_START=324 /DNA_END=1151 /DNA_ORIENTATION=+
MSETRSGRGNSFGQKFANFAQWTLQKFGRAEETKLSEDFTTRVSKFHATKKELQALLKAATVFYTSKMKLQKANAGFHDALAMTGSHAKASPEAVSATQSYVTAGRQLDAEEAKFNKSYKEGILDAIESLLEKEVAQCEAVLKQHAAAHLEFDACNRKWKKMESKARVPTARKQETQEELTRKARYFNDLGHQVANLIAVVESKKNTILHENLEKFMEDQQHFFEKASKHMLQGDSFKSELEAARTPMGKEMKDKKQAETQDSTAIKEDVKETKG